MENLSPGDRRLVSANCENLDYPTVKSSLRKTFGDRQSATSSGGPTLIKEEPVFVTQDASKNQVLFTGGKPGTARGQGGFGGRGPQRGSNPLTKFGTVSRCNICGSTFHWAKQCPDGEKTESGAENIPKTKDYCSGKYYIRFDAKVLLYGEYQIPAVQVPFVELNGISSIRINYLQDRPKVTENNSLKKITFGDGKTIESVK